MFCSFAELEGMNTVTLGEEPAGSISGGAGLGGHRIEEGSINMNITQCFYTNLMTIRYH